tara:strand:- start:67 stop:354 length:288 start_codon:yes stop_codon:yes gene_type:complete
MLKYGEVNPLAVHGLRLTEICPLHFCTVDFDLRTGEKNISDWIYENLSGRFWIGNYCHMTAGGSITLVERVGFEIPAEATYFAMFLDKINKNIGW